MSTEPGGAKGRQTHGLSPTPGPAVRGHAGEAGCWRGSVTVMNVSSVRNHPWRRSLGPAGFPGQFYQVFKEYQFCTVFLGSRKRREYFAVDFMRLVSL